MTLVDVKANDGRVSKYILIYFMYVDGKYQNRNECELIYFMYVDGYHKATNE